MKASLLALISCFLLAAAAWADELGSVQTESSKDGCADSCCGKSCEVCVPKCVTKKKDKPAYTFKCSEFCLPKCSGLLGGCGPCGECGKGGKCGDDGDKSCSTTGCAKCGHVRTKKALIKKVRSTEYCVLECTPPGKGEKKDD